MARALQAAAAIALAVAVVLATTAGAASAHATLISTTPAAGTTVQELPDEVVLEFTEAVDAGLGGIRVHAPDGERVDRGGVEQREGDTVISVGLDDGGEGTYTVVWSVVSQDSHTIAGSFVFSVGRETGAAVSADDDRAALRFGAATARWAAFAGTLLLTGALAFDQFVGSGVALGDRRARLHRLLRLGAALALLGSAGALLTQIALTAGRPLLSSVELVGDAVADTRFGALGFARTALALAAVALTVPATTLSHRSGRVMLGLSCLGLLVVPGLAGHAWTASPRVAAVAVDAVHLLAAGIWAGGLAALLMVAPGSGVAAALTYRFSRGALLAVAVVAATGVVSMLMQVRSFDELTDTSYGVLLIAKVCAVVALVALGSANRHRLAALLPTRETVFNVVRAEVLIAAFVVGITAVLINRPPARSAVVEPFETVVGTENDPADGQVQVRVDPARPGPNDVHLYFLGADGLPRAVDAVELTVEQPEVPARKAAVTPITADHVSAYNLALPSAGLWTLRITAVRDGLPLTATVEVIIR